jgi:hypothetical protein
MFSYELGVVEVERTRVGLFFSDANLREIVDQNLGFDLEFPRQLVNSNLIGF